MAGALDFFQNIGRFGGPDKRFGMVVVLVDVVANGQDQFFDFAEDALPKPVLSKSRKKRSTMLSQELLVGVK